MIPAILVGSIAALVVWAILLGDRPCEWWCVLIFPVFSIVWMFLWLLWDERPDK